MTTPLENTGAHNLESLKRERTNLRRLFTVVCNQFDELQKKADTESTQLQVVYNKLLDKSERLFRIDSELSEFLEHSEEDYDQIESYRDRFIEIKTVFEKYMQTCEDSSSSSASAINLKLPKLNLKEFDLMPRTWVAFWGQFSRIHEDENIIEEDKFQYLLSSLKSKTKARDIAESYPPSKENYGKAIDHLKSRFGRNDLLIEVYIRDLLALVSNRSNVKLAVLYDKLGSYLRALESLGVTTQNYAAMLYPVVESCLPAEVLKAWDRYRLNREIKVEDSNLLTQEKLLENLMSFLRHEVEGEEHRVLAESAFENATKSKKDGNLPTGKYEPTAAALISSLPSRSLGKNYCIFCDRNHLSQECSTASSLSKDERKLQVMKKKCCLVCLKPGHFAKTCRSNVRCIICGRRHYALLCPDLQTRPGESFPKEKVTEIKKSAILLASQPSLPEIYLKTIMIRLRHKGRQICVRALLDDGSHRSYIEREVIQDLKLIPSGTEVLSHGLFGGETTPASEHGRYDITVESLDGKYSSKISFLDQPKICTTLPRIRDKDLISELAVRGIYLTDVGIDIPPIRVLLGADVLGGILTGRIEIMKSGLSAVETLLGWTILGLGKKREIMNMVTINLQNFTLPKLWDLEVLGINDPTETKTKKLLDEETLIHFQETVKINEDQRYEVALPWLIGHPPLPNNYDVAESRLRTLTKRLIKEDIFRSYSDVFLQWKEEGIVEELEKSNTSNSVYYLPHRPVIKLSSPTTKIRPVFDASVKRTGCASLNDCLSTGPSLTHEIPPLLNRFRLGALGVTADIKQAFLQLSVRPEDRDVLRFLWWKDPDHLSIKEYRHCRVVFGVTSSPFLLNATISHHLSSEKFQTDDMLSTVEILKDGFYVDNLITSVGSEEELQKLQRQANEIMQDGCFDLRCWAYTGGQDEENHLVLGLKWNTKTDELRCAAPKVLENLEEKATKRSLLSVINSVYDPIGFTCPAMLLPKLILQEAWRRKLCWDEPLPKELQLKFDEWAKYLHLVEHCSIPRIILHGKTEAATLHIFSDASAYAYACCAFLRCEKQSRVSIALISAKARVAPMNRPTIPRMELLGALIAARLAKSTLEALKLPLKTYLWTDSMVVLTWIVKKELWNTFVGNRVKEIRDLTDFKDWRHVPGENNPADLPSRSCTWNDLVKGKWWQGPSWLKNPETAWPQTKLIFPQEALLERKKVVIGATTIQENENISSRFLYFSDYSKILRMVAWIFRFYENSRRKERNTNLVLAKEEIERAEFVLIKMIQREWSVESKKRYEKSLKFYEDGGMLKIKTRLVFGDDPSDFKCPTVLPDHPIVRRMIEYTHRSLKHAGVQTILAQLRERFWIPRGRKVIREVISSCVSCKRHSTKAVVADTAPLPAERIKRVAAFQVTGADLAGPIFLRGNIKAWIVLFTCAVYRAVHLDLITSLSTEAFIQAMRRFFARRGRVSVMYTDNGTNFVGTSRALQSLDWNAIQVECGIRKIKWNFNPPSAPWYGGWWERMIRVIKDLLRKSLGKASLTYEEMVTILCDTENTINKRPLTYLSEDPNEPLPLTPAHFLQEIQAPIDCDTLDLDIIDGNHLRKRIRYVQRVRDSLKRRFQREYLSELVRNPENAKRRESIQVGDVVLVGSDNIKRINWPLARITELFVGRDGKQRVARLQTASKEIIRPIQRIYPLEIKSQDLPTTLEAKNSPSDKKASKLVAEDIKPQVDESRAKTGAEPIVITRKGRRVIKPDRLDL